MSQETNEPSPVIEAAETAGTPSADPAWDAALAEAAPAAAPETPSEPVAETVAEAAPEPPVETDFTRNELANGEVEVRLATGQVYRGKNDGEILQKLAKAQFEASRTIRDMRTAPVAQPAAPVAEPVTSAAPVIDPLAASVADFNAQGLGFKDAAELREVISQIRNSSKGYEQVQQEQAGAAAAASFMQANPDFVATPANAEKVTNLLTARGWEFTPENAAIVHGYLKSKGEYEAIPVPRNESGKFAPRNPPPPSGSAAASRLDAMTVERLSTMSADDIGKFLDSQYQH